MRVKQSLLVASFGAFALCWSNQLLLADSSLSSGPIVEIITEPPQDQAPTNAARLEISRSRHQLTLYSGETAIKNYPVAVGRPRWETPIGEFQVYQMLQDPVWQHPLTGKIFKAGAPGNQLGHYWIGFWTDGHTAIGFHDTPHPQTVGKPVSHGCLRMHEKDIAELFSQIRIGTFVRVLP